MKKRQAAKSTRVSPARQAALDVLLDWGRDHGYAADLIEQAGSRETLSRPDQAFLRDLVLTTLRNLTCLDEWINVLTSGRHLDDRTAWLLRLGLVQLLILEVAEHASVNETVSLAWKSGGLVNAVLRRTCRERRDLLAMREDWPASVRLSHPEFLMERWTRQWNESTTLALCEWNQTPASMYVRVNRLKAGAEDLLSRAEGLELIGDGFYKCGVLPMEALRSGAAYAQDPSTAMSPGLLAPRPGDLVLDACAAPGGKTAILAERMENQGRIIATDGSKSRLPRLRENLERLGVENAEVKRHRWGADPLPGEWVEAFDRILADVPCSNTGVMRRRVDVRWRLQEQEFEELAAQQFAMTRAMLPCLKPGGVLVYSTCSLDVEENQGVVDRLVREVPGMRCTETKELIPSVDGVDGAYAAVLKREGGG